MTAQAGLDRIPKGLFQDAGDHGKGKPEKPVLSSLHAEASDIMGKENVFSKFKDTGPAKVGDVTGKGDKTVPGLILANVEAKDYGHTMEKGKRWDNVAERAAKGQGRG